MVPFSMMVYLENQDCYVPDNEVPTGARVLNLSGTDLRDRLNEGRDIPAWFTYPEVVYPHSSAVAWYPAGQRLYRSRDGGAHWSPAGTLDGDGQLTSMALSGSDVAVYATLRPVLPPPDPAVLLHVTTDGGRTWTTHPLTATTPAPTSS